MKVCLLFLSAVVAATFAEVPAPYPPSGWRPAKAFLLPVQFRQRYEQYGPPNPAPSYGPPPQVTTEAPVEETTTEQVTESATEEATTEPASQEEETTEPSETAESRANEDGNEVAQPTGLYYVLLPDGRLQRVLYTPGGPELGFSAQLRISDVEPVAPAPVYAYGGPLTRILRRAD